MKALHLPGPLLRARLPRRLRGAFRFADFFLTDFLAATVWVSVSVPGSELGLAKLAACSSVSGENAIATASARTAMRVFLISMFQVPPVALEQRYRKHAR